MRTCDLLNALFFLKHLGHGVDAESIFSGAQRHALKTAAGVDQICYGRSRTGDYEPSATLLRQLSD
jgi:hypothetical protein